MEVKRRLCLQDHTVTDREGTSFTIERGKEYTTSAAIDKYGDVMVFSRYWVRVPANIFELARPTDEQIERLVQQAQAIDAKVRQRYEGQLKERDEKIAELEARLREVEARRL
jgi:hypothetical protein